MHPAIREDRVWFQQHPLAIVRFRPTELGEFSPLQAIGEQPPVFRPSICRPGSPLRWVAVVDLMRLAGASSHEAAETTARLRLRIPAIRLSQRQKQAEDELLDAVCAELLASISADDKDLAA